MSLRVEYCGPCFDPCYDDQTEVLTDSGWKFFKDIDRINDKFATLNPKSLALEYQYPSDFTTTSWHGNLCWFYSAESDLDMMVTPNHQMFCQTEGAHRSGGACGWKLEKAEDVLGKRRYYRKSCDRYDLNQELHYIMVAARALPMDDWVRFLGYYISVGSTIVTEYGHYLVKLEGGDLNDLACALKMVTNEEVMVCEGDGSVIVVDKELGLYLESTIRDLDKRCIPRDILLNASKRQLRILFDAIMCRDNQSSEDGNIYYETFSARLRDDLQELVLKIGLSSSFSTQSILRARQFATEMPPCSGVLFPDALLFDSSEQLPPPLLYTSEHCLEPVDEMNECNSWVVRVQEKDHIVRLLSWEEDRGQSTQTLVPYDGMVYCVTVPNHTLFVRRNGHTVWSGNSGYGNFAKNFIVAMKGAGIDLRVFATSFDAQHAPLGVEERICKSLVSNVREGVDISILNMTPEFWDKYRNPHAINVGFTMFETTRIPDAWVSYCNKMHAVFVPCQWNKDVFEQSGVKVPVYVISPGLNPADFASVKPTMPLLNTNFTDFLFYSIFQWTPRKNPEGLLHAYWAEFTKHDDVCLVLKTYGSNTSIEEQNRIKSVIANLKANQRLCHYPRILFIGGLLSSSQVRDIHCNCDCFVLPHRAEGYGMPHMEAMACGKPVISTNFSGNLEFMNDSNSMLIDYQLTPVHSMPYCPWYEGDMMWAEPNLEQLREKMRYAYEHRDQIKELGLRGRDTLFENFNWNSRIDNMKAILEQILTKGK